MIPSNYKDIDEYLEHRLEEWGEWLRVGNSFGLGYGKLSVIELIRQGRIVTKNKRFYQFIETHEAAEEIENLVSEMAQYKLEMARALRFYYLDNHSLRSSSKKLGISHTRFKLCVAMAKQWLMGRMSIIER